MKSPHLVWFDGPVDGVSFRAYVEQFVVPLYRPEPHVIEPRLLLDLLVDGERR